MRRGARQPTRASSSPRSAIAGLSPWQRVLAARKPRGHPIYAPATLVEVENTHNRAGGVVFPPAEAVRIRAAARAHDVATYLDGARLWNAAIASDRSVDALAAPFDLVAVALSKGLGAPGGTVLAGPRALMPSIVRYRRMAGGAMRQIGIFAAAGLYALDHDRRGHPLAPSVPERDRGLAKRGLVAVGLGELELGAAVLVEEGVRDHVEAVG